MLNEITKLEKLLTKTEQAMIKAGGGTCAAQIGGGLAWTGLSIDEAKVEAAASGGHWCCDSCQSASWLTRAQKIYLTQISNL